MFYIFAYSNLSFFYHTFEKEEDYLKMLNTPHSWFGVLKIKFETVNEKITIESGKLDFDKFKEINDKIYSINEKEITKSTFKYCYLSNNIKELEGRNRTKY